MLEQGAAWLDRMRVKHASRSVTYTRGAETVELSATLGQTTYEVADEFGTTVEAKATDFLITGAELVLAGQKAKPQPGDRIRVTVGDEVHVFEVMSLGAAGHWRPSDPYGHTLRIHTKLVDTEAAS